MNREADGQDALPGCRKMPTCPHTGYFPKFAMADSVAQQRSWGDADSAPTAWWHRAAPGRNLRRRGLTHGHYVDLTPASGGYAFND